MKGAPDKILFCLGLVQDLATVPLWENMAKRQVRIKPLSQQDRDGSIPVDRR
jgi:hypothetical protein